VKNPGRRFNFDRGPGLAGTGGVPKPDRPNTNSINFENRCAVPRVTSARPASRIVHNRDTCGKKIIQFRRVMDEEPEVRQMFFGTGKTWLALIILSGMFAAAYLSLPGFRSVFDIVFGL
jgi:hypothetical protein